MIFSIVEKVNAQEKVQKVIVNGKSVEVAIELENIMTEMLKQGFPEELIMGATYEALNNTGHLARR